MKKLMSVIVSAICAVSALSIGVSVSAAEKITPSGISYENIGTEIDNYINKYETGLASCEVSVYDADGNIFTGCYGHSDIENNVAADESTVYEWGSCSKLLVWISVMQQYERGNIDLEADIREYLPEGFMTKLKYENEKITMIDLMNHTAGFQESWYEDQGCSEDGIFDSLEEAVRYCECKQVYHPGEHTSYSNWGTALAGYIVERVSGMDYVDYVHENILKPLGMEHTSIDPHISDNDYVRKKRGELKCYSRYDDPKYNEDYGTKIAWVQLYPVGSAMGTIGDFSKFGQALTSDKCPLFENESTRELMYSASSFYGDSDIAKNCHGFWTHEHKVQTIGHAGNTQCSSMLQFDPESGLGVVVMTNEPGETIFNYGIPELIFGKLTDRPEYADAPIVDNNDVGGMYFPSRGIIEGAGMFQTYTFGFMPFSKNDDGQSYSMLIDKEASFIKLAENEYYFTSNGRSMFMYSSTDANGTPMLEMMSQDMIAGKTNLVKMVFFWLTILFSAVCVLILAVRLVVFIVRKLRGKTKKTCFNITIQQIIFSVIICVLLLLLMLEASNGYVFTAISAILAALLGIASLLNGCLLCYNTIKSKEIGVPAAIARYIWSALGLAEFIFIVVFQLYNFWSL